jgi:putative ABC transport system permease protein
VSPQMRLAWANVTHNRARAAAAASAVMFAILLLYTQLGFYDTSYRSSTMVFDQFAFDLVLRSPQYTHLRAPGTIPRRRLAEAAAIGDVADAFPLYVANGVYQEPLSKRHREIIVLGVDPRTEAFRLSELTGRGRLLQATGAAIMDRLTRRDYDEVVAGRFVHVEDQRLHVVATYAHGTGLIGDATIIVSDETFRGLFPASSLAGVSLGLLRLAPRSDPEAARARLRAMLPGDVEVLSRAELEAAEQHLFVRVRPTGLMFTTGVLVALVVAVVVVYQVLAAEVVARASEYATLKAIGHSNRFVRGVVLRQAACYGALGSVVALPMALVVYRAISVFARLPMVMTVGRVALVALLASVVATTAALLAVRKVEQADPAELF